MAAVTGRPGPGAATRVIVVGAGLAGLSAAVGARDAGWDVVVVEARDRVGGRVHTIYGGEDGVELASGLRAEMGGESIDEDHTGAPVAGSPLRRRHRTPAGKHERSSAQGPVSTRRRAPTRSMRSWPSAAEPCSRDYRRVYDELERLAERHRVDPENPAGRRRRRDARPIVVRGWLDSLNLVPEARFIAEQAHVSLYNSELRDLSMLLVTQQTAATASIPAAALGDHEIEGRQRLVAEGHRGGARIGARARRTGHRRAPARRHRECRGERSRVLRRARCASRCRHPPLRGVEFDPALPAPIAAAIAELELGAATKVVNQYRSAFWRTHGESGFSMSDLTSRSPGTRRTPTKHRPGCSRRTRRPATGAPWRPSPNRSASRAFAASSPRCSRKATRSSPARPRRWRGRTSRSPAAVTRSTSPASCARCGSRCARAPTASTLPASTSKRSSATWRARCAAARVRPHAHRRSGGLEVVLDIDTGGRALVDRLQHRGFQVPGHPERAGFTFRQTPPAIDHVRDVTLGNLEDLGADLRADAVPYTRRLIDPYTHASKIGARGLTPGQAQVSVRSSRGRQVAAATRTARSCGRRTRAAGLRPRPCPLTACSSPNTPGTRSSGPIIWRPIASAPSSSSVSVTC